MDSLYLKAKTETASKIPCIGYPLVLIRRVRRISSVPKHQPGRVIDIAAFQEKCQNCRALLRGYESFTSPSAAAYATGQPVAICAIILKALKPASLWGLLTPFQSPKRACCLLQEREGPVFPKENRVVCLYKLKHYCKELRDPEMLQTHSVMCHKSVLETHCKLCPGICVDYKTIQTC